MDSEVKVEEKPQTGVPALVIGLWIAVAMWWACYVAHLPTYEINAPDAAVTAADSTEAGATPADSLHDDAPGPLPRFGGRPSPQLLLPILIACIVAGGFWAGRLGRAAAISRGAGAGLIAAIVNLLLFGSVLSRADSLSPNAVVPSSAVWILGFALTSALAAAIGAAMGQRRAPSRAAARDWTASLTKLLLVATFLQMITGGLVTSENAGMAVPDWPTTEGSNMFLFPLTKMTGGVFLEHSHRLFGALVGLVMLTTAVHLWRRERRSSVRLWAAAGLVLVIGQGILGGQRVALNARFGTPFRVFHGVVAQLYLALVVVIMAACSVAWKRGRATLLSAATNDAEPRTPAVSSVRFDRRLALAFWGCVVLQLILGALTRHVDRDRFVMTHMAFAMLVIAAGFMLCLRISMHFADIRPLSQAGAGLGLLLFAQLVLGFVAFAVTGGDETVLSSILATAHQACGAAILATATFCVSWLTHWLELHHTSAAHTADPIGGDEGIAASGAQASRTARAESA